MLWIEFIRRRCLGISVGAGVRVTVIGTLGSFRWGRAGLDRGVGFMQEIWGGLHVLNKG